jgi:hypothetical protein
MSHSDTKPFPKFSDYPQTEAGWNQYDNEWVSRRRLTPNITGIPKEVLEEHWASMSLGRKKGWEERE